MMYLRTFLVVFVLAGLLPVASIARAVTPAKGAVTKTDFPRIGEYNGFGNSPSKNIHITPLWSRYGMAIVPDSLTWRSPSTLAALRKSAPNQTLLAYDRTYPIFYTDQDRYGEGAIDPDWWLLHAGSTLRASIDSTQTVIPVVDTARFKRYDDVLVDAESMHVVKVDAENKTLHVERGFYSRATSHAAGRRIAAHANPPYAENAPTNADPSDPADRRSWALNLSILCPKNSQGQRWGDHFARWVRDQILSNPNWDGMFLDNTNDILYEPTIDVDNDNQPDAGFVTYNGVPNTNVWKLGIDDLFAQLARYAPDHTFVGDGFAFGNMASVSGQNFNMMEILDDDHYQYLRANYPYHMAASRQPALSFINTRTISGPPDYRVMRYGLGTTLLDDGVYVYDRGPFLQNEQAPAWWFDEWADGAGTALRAGIDDQQTTLPVVSSAKFAVGDIVWVNREAMQITEVEDRQLTVKRGANSTIRLRHDQGSVVATLEQFRQGSGYLGQPTGKAFPVGPVGESILPNSDFEAGSLAPWSGYSAGSTLVDASIGYVNGQSNAARLIVSEIDTSKWNAQLRQDDIALRKGQNYILSFRARANAEHKIAINVCSRSIETGPQCFLDLAVPVHSSPWSMIEIPFTAPQTMTDVSLKLGIGDVPTTTWFDDVKIVPVTNPVTQRYFTNGTVLVNHTAKSYSVDLTGKGYCYLRGDQNPTLNSGAMATEISVPPKDAIILKTCDGLLALDAFDGDVQGGWGEAEMGGRYAITGDATDTSVNGSAGRVRLSQPGAGFTATLSAVSARDIETIFRVRTDKAATGDGQDLFFTARQVGDDAYRMRLRVRKEGTVEVGALRVVDGQASEIGASVRASVDHEAHGYIWVRARVSGTSPATIQIRIWSNGEPEPSAWAYTGTDSTALLQRNGAVGFGAILPSSATNVPVSVLFDSWRVRDVRQR